MNTSTGSLGRHAHPRGFALRHSSDSPPPCAYHTTNGVPRGSIPSAPTTTRVQPQQSERSTCQEGGGVRSRRRSRTRVYEALRKTTAPATGQRSDAPER